MYNFQNLINCDKCKNVGWIFYKDENGELHCKYCTCWPQRKIMYKLDKIGLGKYLNKTLDDFKTTYNWQVQMKNIANRFIKEGFENGNWMLLCGQYGSGKSLLASITIKEILSKYEEVVPLSFTWASFVEQLKMAFSAGDRDKIAQLNFHIEDMKEVDILYLDEVFKVESQSTLNLLFDIINYRYLTNKATIITSEKNFEEIKKVNQAIASRIFEKIKDGYLIDIQQDERKNQRLK